MNAETLKIAARLREIFQEHGGEANKSLVQIIPSALLAWAEALGDEPVYEYRALSQEPDRAFPREDFRGRTDDEMWQDWKGEPANPEGDGPPVDTTDLSGVEGLAHASARERVAWAIRDGKRVKAWVERRVVGPWERV